MMQGVVQRGTGTAAGAGLNRPIAGKTGTTQDFQDAWFAGFTPDLVTVVWVGFDTPASLGNNETGGAVAAPIWHDFMAAALKGRPALTFPAPPGVTVATLGQRFRPGHGRLQARAGARRVGAARRPAGLAAASAVRRQAARRPGAGQRHRPACIERAAHVRRIRRPERADQASRWRC